ncbi:MAG TPA: transglutaminase family protein [Propionicimonas sp.]|nr:transglutaminase family protein [Propionicimonas sp.]HRA07175.1 transglutaminase family protein [Propionicimonas sp.]
MNRFVRCELELAVDGPAELVFSLALAQDLPLATERLDVTVDGRKARPTELLAEHGTRLHCLSVSGGEVGLRYSAEVPGLAPSPQWTPLDRLRYLRQSRYCEADTLAPTAAAEFVGLSGTALLAAVVEWVHSRIRYVSGSSTGTDSAVTTLLAREGVCRDFAHLAITLLRSLGVPARLAAVYAPGLSPMEFHAVSEALVDGQWWVLDATKLAPRRSLLRVATGRDAADTAFLTSNGASVALTSIDVTAVTDQFELDDQVALTQLR